MSAVIDQGTSFATAESAPRRQSPRVHVSLPAAVLLAGDTVVHARTRDVSLHGLRLRTDRKTAGAIHPSGRAIRNGELPEIRVAIGLPGPDGTEKCVARCAIAHFGITEDGDVEFGIEFLELAPRGRRSLERFIARSLEPAL